MTDYKDTLNLPKTAFPMRANLAQREPAMAERWEENEIYLRIRSARKGQPRFVLHDGPPYANGDIHLGHALNHVLKDMILKSQSLSGKDAPFVPGWDCHGLPIEHQVERREGKVGSRLDAREFRKACRAYAAKQVDRQRIDLRRLGVLGDWDDPYLTMDPRYEAEQLRAFAKLLEQGLVYRGYKPVHWCLDCRSALAEAEVEYQDKKSTAIDVRFAVNDPGEFARRLGASLPDGVPVSVPIWTTTPWTLPGNQAVALNADLAYSLVGTDLGHGPELLLVATEMAEGVRKRFNATAWDVVAGGEGRALEGLLLAHPFYDRNVPIVLGEHVTTEAGTGAVHTAPGHGLEDFAMGIAYELPLDCPVDPSGRYRSNVELLAGEHIDDANDKVVDLLRDNKALVHAELVAHSYPHCWRHKTPVIFRATPQWFIGMDRGELRKHALAAIEAVEWTPAWGEERIRGMVENRPDWCISRQRTWGVPIPLFIDKDTESLHPDSAKIALAAADRVETGGIDAWFELDPADLLGGDAEHYVKVEDVMDVWLDSGLSHHVVGTLRSEVGMPVDLYLEGSDQHRGWFQSSLLTSVGMYGRAPYRSVLTHGFTVDEHGHKMSKSLGNVVEPQKVYKTLGADILRLWVAATDYRAEMSASQEILNRVSDAYRRMRNTQRFLLGNLHGFDPASDKVAPSDMVELDRWICARAKALQDQVIEAYERYEFHHIYHRVHNFCVLDLGGFYLDVIKDRLYTTPTESHPRRSAQTAMHHIAEAMVRWLAPILSFTAEEIWSELPGARDESVFLATWHAFPAGLDEASIDWERMLTIREAVSKELERLRVRGDIGSPLEAEVAFFGDDIESSDLHELDNELRFVLITSEASTHRADERPDDALAVADGLWVKVVPSDAAKCARCWHRRTDVGAHQSHPTICERCVGNVVGSGEERRFA